MSKYQQTNREESGRLLQNNVKRLNERNYQVKSLSRDEIYKILITSIGWVCSCADHMFRGVKCKHIYAVEFSLELRKTVEVQKIEPISITGCKYCKSDNLVKDGIRKNKHGDIQKFECRDCKRYFTINIGFEKMKHNPQGITTAMQLYFSGESLRNVAHSLMLIGMEVSHQTIYNWIDKYTSRMNKYLDKITPKVSTLWRTDELYLKVKGNIKYLYALMDDETRFWIAQQVAETKNTADITPLFSKGKEVAGGTRPNTLISDGAPNFHTAFNRELYTNKWPRTRHINHIRLQGDHNNNKMERMNGEIRDREKTMIGLKKADTPILKGCQIFHNYIREHQALGMTPAEKCGIEIQGENKWLTLIQNAMKEKHSSIS
jgi:putative transposase